MTQSQCRFSLRKARKGCKSEPTIVLAISEAALPILDDYFGYCSYTVRIQWAVNLGVKSKLYLMRVQFVYITF